MIPPPETRRSECPISSSLDLLGDKWTLLVLRDAIDGKRRFSEFERSPERIPTNILSDRLRRLVDADLLQRIRSGESSRHVYEPTARGRDLRPVLLELAAWGNRHLAETWIPPTNYLEEKPPPKEA